MTLQTIGVVGAGTMGAGIAQVAAAAGHPVKLLDVRPGAAQEAIDQTAKALAALVDKGRISADARGATLARLSAVETSADFADAGLVLEVIVEKLEAKQQLLRELEAIVSPRTVLASNTSSISITAIANGLQHPPKRYSISRSAGARRRFMRRARRASSSTALRGRTTPRPWRCCRNRLRRRPRSMRSRAAPAFAWGRAS